MKIYEKPIMEITILDVVGTLIDVSTGGNETTVPGSRTEENGNFG